MSIVSCSLVHIREKSGSAFSPLSQQGAADVRPPRTLSSDWTNPVLTLFSCIMCPKPWLPWGPIPWTHYSLPLFFLCRAQNCTDCSRCHGTSAKQKEMISSLDLLTTLLLVQPRMFLSPFAVRHCLLVFKSLFIKTPRYFSAKHYPTA